MKFDKFMNILYRVFVISLAIFIVVGCVVSCSRPITACAIVEPHDIASYIRDFYDEYKESLDRIEQALATDINNGTIDQTTALGREYLSALALQSAVVSDPTLYNAYMLANAYNDGVQEANKFISYLENNPTINFSGSGACGLYRVYGSNDIKICNINLYPDGISSSSKIILVDAPDFIIYVVPTDNTTTVSAQTYINGDLVVKIGRIPYYGSSNFACESLNNSLIGFSNNSEVNSGGYSIRGDIPSLMRIYSSGNNYPKICGQYASSQIPESSVDTDSPWDYYNDTIIPYMQTNFPDVPDDYYVFPYGYYTPEPTEPTEPPTFPNGGIYIDKQYNIGINIIYPTDASGQPVTDASGETVTETEYITDTSPLDGEYSFKMPTLARLNMVDATLPNPDISGYSDGINFVWNMCYNILTDSGFMPVVMIVFALALFGFILWKLGG